MEFTNQTFFDTFAEDRLRFSKQIVRGGARATLLLLWCAECRPIEYLSFRYKDNYTK